MSMELYVLSDAMPESVTAWQNAIEAHGFALRLEDTRAFADLSGATPVRFGDVPTAFECDHRDAGLVMDELPEIAFDRRWSRAVALRWGADMLACVAAYAAASGLAAATGGVVVDCAEGALISAQRAADIARENERQIPLIEEAVRRATEEFGKR